MKREAKKPADVGPKPRWKSVRVTLDCQLALNLKKYSMNEKRRRTKLMSAIKLLEMKREKRKM